MKRPKVFFSVGEKSGDLIAAGVIRALGSEAICFGVCGPKMIEQGCTAVESMESFQAFGVSDVVQKIPKIVGRYSQLIAEIERIDPDVVVLVDAPGLHFQLAERLRGLNIPIVQLVAPKLWAWGASRVKRLRRDFAKVLGILPFERKFFEDHGVKYKYVGCPVVDRVGEVLQEIALQEKGREEKNNAKWYAALPGSRLSEWSFFLPFFAKFLRENAARKTKWVIPVSDNLEWGYLQKKFSESLSALKGISDDQCKLGLDKHKFSVIASYGPVSFVKGDSLKVMALAEACLVSSGTVALESALLQKKTVVIYKLDDLTYRVAKALVQIPYVSLPNLALSRPLLDEHLQQLDVHSVSASLFSSPMDQKGYESLVECFTPMDYAKCRNEVLELV